ncbi:hypothetical protein [Maridesulfovibrio sp.]|uniref:hypothetical protein n=1 Tax=Maridesulfovibrio sp. TaxID=2795000 RepID=UPI0039EE6B50
MSSIAIPTDRPGDLSKVKKINEKGMTMYRVYEDSEENYQSYIEDQKKFLECLYAKFPDPSSSPANSSYATVEVNGQVVCKIDNNGFVESSNAAMSGIQNALHGSQNMLSGPSLAQDRAEKIAETMGGVIVKSPSAMTQDIYNSISSPKVSVDYAAMKSDPIYYQLQLLQQQRAEYLENQKLQDG